jgi:hypothetical protein
MSAVAAHDEWIKVDLHIHTLDDPKDVVDYSAHQLLERARSLGFRVLAITLHDAVFDRPEVFADALAMGIYSFPQQRCGCAAQILIVLNVSAKEVAGSKVFMIYDSFAPGEELDIYDSASSILYFWRLIGPRLLEEIGALMRLRSVISQGLSIRSPSDKSCARLATDDRRIRAHRLRVCPALQASPECRATVGMFSAPCGSGEFAKFPLQLCRS